MSKEEVDVIMDKFFELQNTLSKFEKEEEKASFVEENLDTFKIASNLIQYLISKNEFKIHYQPQVSDNDNWTSAEALFRLKYNDRAIYPDVVFFLSKYFNYEKELTLSLLDRVCKDTNIIKQESSTDFYVTYNINPKLINKEFCKEIIKTVYQNELSPKNIGIELLEVSSFDNIDLDDINLLKQYGFKILVDDFGTGYADEDVVKRIPFDIVKFSDKLITGIDKQENLDNKNRVIEIVDYCKSNGIKTVAEHVETKEELNTVRDLGIDKVQGWYFSKDLPLDTFISKCNKKSIV